MRVRLAAAFSVFLLLSGFGNKTQQPLDPKGHLVFVESSVSGYPPTDAVYSIDLSQRPASPRMLTPGSSVVFRLVWDRGSSRFLYQVNVGQEIEGWRSLDTSHAMDTVGNGKDWDNINRFYGEFAFSPDGRYVAGVPVMNDYHLRIVSNRGSDPSHDIIGQAAWTALSGPAWSPDGSKLVFVGALGGDINYTELFVVDRDGNHLKQITDIPRWIPWWAVVLFDRVPKRHDLHKSGDPHWSPDGQWIAFMSFEGIYRVHPDGTGLKLIVKDAAHPAWSPDGQMLAYVALRGDKSDKKVSDFYVSLADGSNETRLTDLRARMLYEYLNWVN